MAECLVKYWQNTTFDIGDVVVVKEDGFQWSEEEHPNTAKVKHFIIVKIPGVPVEDVLSFLESHYDGPFPTNPDDPQPNLVYKRKWKVDNIKIPQPIKNELEANGEITITDTQFYNFTTDKTA